MKRVIVVLSGGGGNGIRHLGMLRWLSQHGYEVVLALGVSIGALVAAMVMDGRLNQLRSIWPTLDGKKLLKKRGAITTGWGLFRTRVLGHDHVLGLYDLRALYRLCKEHVPDAPIAGAFVGAVSTSTARYHCGPASLHSVNASMTAPLIFPPYRCQLPDFGEGDAWVDGGAWHVTPIGDALRMAREEGIEVDEIVVSMCQPSEFGARAFRDDLEYALWTMETIMTAHGEADVAMAQQRNREIMQGAELYHSDGTPYRVMPIHVSRPRASLGDWLNFNERWEEKEREGYESTAAAMGL